MLFGGVLSGLVCAGLTVAVRRRTGWTWAVTLGLFVWSLVTAHCGTVELDTAPGEGATFRIRLPRSV